MQETEIIIRPLSPDDSLDELTALLHRGYKQLADMGLRFVATYQDVDVTRKRVGRGECFVAEYRGKIIATVCYYPPRTNAGRGSKTYERFDVALFGQFAVEPEYQNHGIGSLMVQYLENHARQNGVVLLCLDTSEKAEHLIKWYNKLGYEFIEYIDWPVTNYRSVILAKEL